MNSMHPSSSTVPFKNQISNSSAPDLDSVPEMPKIVASKPSKDISLKTKKSKSIDLNV